jgi:4-amino-4-deoxy-L-arabinose transferase-like glycosyltransferase
MHRTLPHRIAAGLSGAAAWLAAPATAPASYPNHLAAPRPTRTPVSFAPWLAVFLVLACLIPRLLMALKVDVVCVDGVLYLRLAQALEQGILNPPDSMGMQLNFYSTILAQLHRLGLSWEFAPKVLGVTLSSLAVLPIFGWVRRQFDDRVAVVACLLYAVHPDLIEWSPEAMREPMFWFFFTLALYLSWRAVVEVRLGFYFAAGIAITLSALTRVEGLFLVIPLAWWTVVRWQALEEGRRRLLLGTALVAAAFPAVLIAVNLAWVGNDTSWALLRTGPLQRVQWWAESWIAPEMAEAIPVASPTGDFSPTPDARGPNSRAAAAASLPAAPLPHLPFVVAAWRYVDRMGRGLWPPFALLMFGGYFGWRRVFDRRDHLPLAVVGLAIAGGAWIHLWNTQDLSSRYALTIVVMSLRCAALGWFGMCGWVMRFAARVRLKPAVAAALPLALLALLAMTGWADALSGNFENREALANLGRWIRAEYGDSCMLVGSERQLPLVGYYARASANVAPRGLSSEPFARWVEGMHPDVVVISQRHQTPQDYAVLLQVRERLGLEIVDAARMPFALHKTIVLAPVAPHQPQQPQRAAATPSAESSAGDALSDVPRPRR